MADVDRLSAAPRARIFSHTTVWYLFLAAVSIASLLPILVIPATYHLTPIGVALYTVAAINLLGATFHVAATGWFFTDPVMRAYFRSKPVRYWIVPLSIIVTSALALQFLDRRITNYMIAAYLLWQLWHYQKQNFGLLSFVSAGTDGVPLSTWERRTLGIAALPGMLGFFRFFDIGMPQREPEFVFAHHIGLATYAIVAVFFVIALTKNPQLRTNKLRLAFFSYGTLFFLPTYIFPDGASAISGFALAHGLQYLVFMGVVSGRSKNPFLSGALFLGISLVGYFLLSRGLAMRDLANAPAYAGLLSGAALGVVMSHFVMDADIWRMRGAFQRGYMRQKFDFVFGR